MTANALTYARFFLAACRREVCNRYMNSTFGVLWLFLNPVLQLAIYYFVFEIIFQIKFNTAAGQNFITFLAVGLWPWVAFSEALVSGTNAIDKHKDLLKKIYIPSSIFVAVEVIVPFAIHFIGLIFALLVIRLFLGQSIEFVWLPIVLLVYVIQCGFCLGLSLLLAGLQVFLKDVAQILTPIVMVWFYLTPVIYPPHLVPEGLQVILQYNPLSHFVFAYRELLLAGNLPSVGVWGWLFCFAVVSVFLGFAVFKRLSTRFEDMF
ncbi:ABC transporter permease [Ostreibacterium oceani]|uniref:Transport permease protein n=1 Tax=Ostreibacterium oceani TaxID=2654998 RepID=A0A6N7EZ02_9GAMM|nr:ABC transporter permease [Ostreibacterium oceani]MPV86790.1 hypothetical protein [Ostreibacterium oceani]